MKTLLRTGLLAVLLVLVRPISATTVIPPSFNELVDQAELIFQGRVAAVKSQWVGEGSNRHIATFVTFAVDDTLKGDPGKSYTLQMLGGTVDGETMGIVDAPKFDVGDNNIVFVQNNGSQVIPLVGIMHGRFRIKQDQTGRTIVATNDGQPVTNVARLGTGVRSNENEAGLSPEQFKAAVAQRVRQSIKSIP